MEKELYLTNNGFCYVFLIDNQNIILATSDYEYVYDNIFNGDSEIGVKRVFEIDNTKYKVIEIKGEGNPDLANVFIEWWRGAINPYSYILFLFLEPVS